MVCGLPRPRLRYGCTGASADGVFYVIGGLKIDGPPTGAADAQMYMSSMDLYDVEVSVWLRSRAVLNGGCVIAACAAVGFIYVLTSHAVEMSFLRFDARQRHGGFGEWSRMKTPQLAQPWNMMKTLQLAQLVRPDASSSVWWVSETR